VGKRCATSPPLESLPPTTEAFLENVKRAHLQMSVWKSVKDSNPPNVEVENFGWMKDCAGKCLDPVTLPPDVKLAPDFVMQLIKCNCKISYTTLWLQISKLIMYYLL
jgi:hypothetical protein